MAKSFTVKLTEEELQAVIHMHALKMATAIDTGMSVNPETSARLHDLTKRLTRETPEIENDPRPKDWQNQPIPSSTPWGSSS